MKRILEIMVLNMQQNFLFVQVKFEGCEAEVELTENIYQNLKTS